MLLPSCLLPHSRRRAVHGDAAVRAQRHASAGAGAQRAVTHTRTHTAVARAAGRAALAQRGVPASIHHVSLPLSSLQVTTVLTALDVSVSSANINTGSGDGPVRDVFRITDASGGKASLCVAARGWWRDVGRRAAGAQLVLPPPADTLPPTALFSAQLPPEQWEELRQRLLAALSTTRSRKPTIFGAVAEADSSSMGCAGLLGRCWAPAGLNKSCDDCC